MIYQWDGVPKKKKKLTTCHNALIETYLQAQKHWHDTYQFNNVETKP